MSVEKLSDGRWIVRFRKGTIPDDPERTRVYFGRGPIAETAARRKNREIFQEKENESGHLFADLADEYLKSRASDMAATTFESTFYCLEAHLLPFFGSRDIYDIDAALLDEYVHERKKPQEKRGKKLPAGKGYETRIVRIKNVTIHRELSIVKAIVSWSFGRRLISGNKIAGYKLPKRDDLIQSPPTPSELAAIINHSPPHLKRAITLAFYTALRPGRSELLSLEWSAVNFADSVIFIESAKKNGIPARMVPLNNILLKALQEWHREDKDFARKRKDKPGKIPDNIVHYKGQKIGSLKTAWRTAKNSAGITRTLKLYTLRHAATFHLLAAGNDPRTVSGITGNTLEVMLSKYFQSSNSMKVAAVEGMPDIIESNPGASGASKLIIFKK